MSEDSAHVAPLRTKISSYLEQAESLKDRLESATGAPHDGPERGVRLTPAPQPPRREVLDVSSATTPPTEPTERVIIVIVTSRGEKKEKRKRKRTTEEREREKKEERKREKRTSPFLRPVCRFKTSPCVGSKRFRVYGQTRAC